MAWRCTLRHIRIIYGLLAPRYEEMGAVIDCACDMELDPMDLKYRLIEACARGGFGWERWMFERLRACSSRSVT